MDNVSGFRQRNSHVPSYNPGLFYAVSDTNVPHRIVLSGGWDLPFDEYLRGAPKFLTRGWSLYPIASYQSGFPLDVSANLQRSSSNPGPTGYGDQELVRVNLVGEQGREVESVRVSRRRWRCSAGCPQQLRHQCHVRLRHAFHVISSPDPAFTTLTCQS